MNIDIDGATSQTIRQIIQLLGSKFAGRLIYVTINIRHLDHTI